MTHLQSLADKFSGARITLELPKEQIKILLSEITDYTSGVHSSGKDCIQVKVGQTEFLIMEQ